jgi:hypothetical protein
MTTGPSRAVITNGKRDVLVHDLPADLSDLDVWWQPISTDNGLRVELLNGQHGAVIASAYVGHDTGPFWLRVDKGSSPASGDQS